jgi:N-glycosylase/DNA lyase
LLQEPLSVAGHSRPLRYRFPRQRAHRIAGALRVLASDEPPNEPRAMREWLRAVPGIGPKTASWIVRNVTASSEVAIIDIHIRRAGVAIGCFLPRWRLPRDYGKFEHAFLLLAAHGDVPAAQLDATIWFELQRLGATARLYGVETRLPEVSGR